MADSWHFDGNPEHGSPSSFMTLSWRIHGVFLVLSPLAMFGFAMKVPYNFEV